MIVVADATKTSRESIAHLRHQMKSVGGHIIGGILHNRAPVDADRSSPYKVPAVSGTPHSTVTAEDQPEAATTRKPRPQADGGLTAKAPPVKAAAEPKASTRGFRPNVNDPP